MITIRRSQERGHFDHGWLKTYHSFSFGEYHDSRFMGFRVLRVLNEDWVQPGEGFPTHAHRDMEILTYILEGALEHRDSMGNTSVIRAGDVQRMSAGTGVQHSEFNASASESVHLLQIWFSPESKGIKPGYEQKTFDPKSLLNQLRLVASPDGRAGSVSMHQDVLVYDCRLEAVKRVNLSVNTGRGLWIQVIEGRIEFAGQTLKAGDGAALENEKEAVVIAVATAHFVIFDLPD